jgi:hypothetical protein
MRSRLQRVCTRALPSPDLLFPSDLFETESIRASGVLHLVCYIRYTSGQPAMRQLDADAAEASLVHALLAHLIKLRRPQLDRVSVFRNTENSCYGPLLDHYSIVSDLLPQAASAARHIARNTASHVLNLRGIEDLAEVLDTGGWWA